MSDWNEAINAAMNLCENYSAKQGEPIQGYDWGYKDALADIKSMLGSLKRPADQDGWKLVPVEATEEMKKCVAHGNYTTTSYGDEHTTFDYFSEENAADVWRDMISRAPTPEANP